MPSFVNPIWLAGLAGLLIPVGIHLLSRKESKVIKIGSLRHLQPSTTKQSVSLRLNEILLLALRCLLIILLTLLLSGLYFDRLSKESWLLVENGLETDPDFVPLIDSLQQQGYTVHSLAENFPPFHIHDSSALPSYWMLAEDLQRRPLDQIVVIAHNYTEGFRGRRIAIPERLKWISKNPAPEEFTLSAVRLSPDSLTIRTGHTAGEATTFDYKTVRSVSSTSYAEGSKDPVVIDPADTLRIVIAYAPDFEYDKKILQASLRAIDDATPSIIRVTSVPAEQWSPSDDDDWLILLTEKSSSIRDETNCITYRATGRHHAPLFEKELNHRWTLSKRLNEELALKEKLPIQLSSILLPANKETQRSRERDRRVMPDETLWTSATVENTDYMPQPAQSAGVTQWLAAFLLVTLIAERIVATKRNQ